MQTRIKFALLVIDNEALELPEIDHTAVVRMQSHLFRRAIESVKRHKQQAKSVTISSTTVTFQGEGIMSKTLVNVPHEDDDFKTVVGVHISALYQLNILKHLKKWLLSQTMLLFR